jgi:hypothetical protein
MGHIATPSMTPAKLRQFGLLVGGLFAFLFGLLPGVFGSGHWPAWPWIVGAALVVPALVAPATLSPIYDGWMRVGSVLGWINTRILLFIVFCLLIVPIGTIMRMTGRDPLQRGIDRAARTYRINCDDRPHGNMETPY